MGKYWVAIEICTLTQSVCRKESIFAAKSKESDTKIFQSIYFAYKPDVCIISSYANRFSLLRVA